MRREAKRENALRIEREERVPLFSFEEKAPSNSQARLQGQQLPVLQWKERTLYRVYNKDTSRDSAKIRGSLFAVLMWPDPV